jgi:hypothetical protein
MARGVIDFVKKRGKFDRVVSKNKICQYQNKEENKKKNQSTEDKNRSIIE